MVRKELVAEVGRRAGAFRNQDVALVVQVIFEAMADALTEGERIELRGFGTFQTRVQSARWARNPKTGETVWVEERRKVAFTPGKEMKVRVDY